MRAFGVPRMIGARVRSNLLSTHRWAWAQTQPMARWERREKLEKRAGHWRGVKDETEAGPGTQGLDTMMFGLQYLEIPDMAFWELYYVLFLVNSGHIYFVMVVIKQLLGML